LRKIDDYLLSELISIVHAYICFDGRRVLLLNPMDVVIGVYSQGRVVFSFNVGNEN